jgi:ketosteroid isomerase-like protein
MSASDNVTTVKAIYDAFGRADVATILESVSDDVDWATEGETGAAPWYGRRIGKDQVASFFSDLGSIVEVHEFTPLSVVANDDNEVHTLIRFGFSSRQTGREATMNLHHYWRFRDGKVEYYRGSEDTALTAAILEPSSVTAG